MEEVGEADQECFGELERVSNKPVGLLLSPDLNALVRPGPRADIRMMMPDGVSLCSSGTIPER